MKTVRLGLEAREVLIRENTRPARGHYDKRWIADCSIRLQNALGIRGTTIWDGFTA